MKPELRRVRAEVSARHLHLSQADQDKLFGSGHQMKIIKDLSQRGQWAAEETLVIRGPKGEFKIRALGPCRSQTQIELSRTDCFALGVPAALRLSGDLQGTPGCKLVGPKGEIDLAEGVIVPLRHIHISDAQANERGLKNGDKVRVRLPGVRSTVFEEVNIRVHPTFDLALHLDTDEGNAAWADMKGGEGEIVE
ncbi:MAG: phosphate propanoyltransferase [Patescibacteria group bacterium]|jgi:propanediol utilization protein